LKSLEYHRIVGEVRGTGLWAAIDLTTDKVRHGPFPADRLRNIVERSRQEGMIIKFMNMALEFAPPLIITKAEIDEAIRILDRCISAEEKAMGL